MKLEIYRLIGVDPNYIPTTLNFIDKLWWYFVPGVIVNVQWPTKQPADPNYHYRPFLEQYVGHQGWDWDWGMANRDATDNRLTIKIRQKHAQYATIIAMRWS